MDLIPATRPASVWGDLKVPPGSHICWFYNNSCDRDRATISFLKAGLATQKGCSYIGNHSILIKKVLRQEGVDVDTIIPRQQLVLVDPTIGCFGHEIGTETLLTTLEHVYDLITSSGFGNLYLAEDMTWLASNYKQKDKLLEYEIKLHDLIRKHQAIAICQYDITTISAEMLLGLFRTHPIVIWDKTPLRNPFYLEGVVMLQKLGKETYRQYQTGSAKL